MLDRKHNRQNKTCSHKNCERGGEYPAPKNPSMADGKPAQGQYLWFCLLHIREYNKSWDFFAGFGEEEIEKFRSGVDTGHRPTWKVGYHGMKREACIKDSILNFKNPFKRNVKNSSHLEEKTNPREKKALEILGLPMPVKFREIKQRYKELVKKYHPDKNQGCTKAEERFKKVSNAYSILKNSSLFQ